MSEITPKQKTLVKARMASRICAALVIFGGAVILLLGLWNAYLPEFLEGLVLMATSMPLFVLAKYAEKKLNEPSV